MTQKGGCRRAAEEKAQGHATGFAKSLQPHLLQLARTVPVEQLLQPSQAGEKSRRSLGRSCLLAGSLRHLVSMQQGCSLVRCL